jgi:serine/threonine protein kinase
MTPEDWERLGPLFERALELNPEERETFIDNIVAHEELLGRQLRDLVRAHEASTNSMEPLPAEPRIAFDGGRCFSVNELVLDRFRIVRFIGRGGMGEVYEAIDMELGRVALKTIRPELSLNDSVMRRFRQEVQLARRITSPLVSRVYELFMVPAKSGRPGIAFLTMEYLEGITLAERIEQDGGLAIKVAESIALQLCSALESIHKADVVHRDLKPGNIMLIDRDNVLRVVVMDLGLARDAEAPTAAAGTASEVTRPGAVMGTPEFMAPEQFEGATVTAAADIYAFGAVLFAIVTGKNPFEGASPLAAAVHRAKRLPPASSLNPSVPRHWDHVIGRCLEYEPEKRFQDAGEIARALRGEMPGIRRPLSTRGRRSVVILTAAVMVLLVGSAVAAYLRFRPTPQLSPEVSRWYEIGATALREATYVKATRAFQHVLSLDPSLALAHASLAEAWAELDLTGKAQEEMLRASAMEANGRLSDNEKRHIDAVRAMITRDFQTAERDFAALLAQATPSEKAQRYLDLGRVYEKAGNASEALKNYTQAGKLAPEEPAAFVRLGILESREGRTADAERDFTQAEALYQASSNTEGVAEINYQRGYAASLRWDLPSARRYLGETLHAAQDIPSAQLGIRALIRLGVVEDQADNLDQCAKLEKQAVQLATENKMDYWGVDALSRLGNAYQYRGDFASAEPVLQESVRLAHESQMDRLEANGHLALANTRSQQDKPDEALAFAQSAREYYRKAGFAAETISATILIGRAETAKGDLRSALAEASQAIEPAHRSGSPSATMQAEELLGSVLLNLQEYPEALHHFQTSLGIAKTSSQNLDYQLLHCADVLWQLGRYQEADEMLAAIPPAQAETADIKREILDIAAKIELSRGDARGALERARRGLKLSNLRLEEFVDFENVSALALAALHAYADAEKASASAVQRAAASPSPQLAGQASLVAAQVKLAASVLDQASRAVEEARPLFSAAGRKEFEFVSLACLARIRKSSGDSEEASKFAKQALDILAGLEHNWGTSIFQTYISRADLHSEREFLLALEHKGGGSAP